MCQWEYVVKALVALCPPDNHPNCMEWPVMWWRLCEDSLSGTGYMVAACVKLCFLFILLSNTIREKWFIHSVYFNFKGGCKSKPKTVLRHPVMTLTEALPLNLQNSVMLAVVWLQAFLWAAWCPQLLWLLIPSHVNLLSHDLLFPAGWRAAVPWCSYKSFLSWYLTGSRCATLKSIIITDVNTGYFTSSLCEGQPWLPLCLFTVFRKLAE